MGELIELLFKAVVWMIVVSVYAMWHLVRWTALAAVYVINLTIRLVQQHNSQQYSPDRRQWWNGREGVAGLPKVAWIVPASAAAVLVAGSHLCMSSLTTRPNSPPAGAVANAVASPSAPLTASSTAPTPTPPSPSPSPVAPTPTPTPKTVQP